MRLVLEELGEDYDYVAVDRSTYEQQSDAYKRLNPQGLLPVLLVPGQDAPMFETAAIMLFLADRTGCLAPAPQSAERGRFLKWLFFLSNTLHSDLRISYKPERYLPAVAGRSLLLETLLGRIASGMEIIDREIAARSGVFLLGAEPSCADLYIGACARWAQIYPTPGKWDLSATPNLKTMLETLETWPSVQKASALESITGRPFTRPRPVALPGVTA